MKVLEHLHFAPLFTIRQYILTTAIPKGACIKTFDKAQLPLGYSFYRQQQPLEHH